MQDIEKRYPVIELPYDKMLHREVHSSMYMLCPYGQQATLWFTYLGEKNVAVLTTYNKNKKVKQHKIVSACFDSKLSNGTVISGIFFTYNYQKCFSCEKVVLYNNQYISNHKSNTILIDIITKYTSQIAYSSNMLLIALPIITRTLEAAIEKSLSIPYNISYVRLMKHSGITKNIIRLPKRDVIFSVSAEIEPDIYNLHCIEKYSKQVHYGIAAVQSYKTSILLNSIFRNIRENNNLDLLEESEDEDDFENISKEKFVDVTKSIKMRCIYRHRCRKWEPVSVAAETAFVSNYTAIKRLEN